jgi:acyl-coenzyme A thioesterase 9
LGWLTAYRFLKGKYPRCTHIDDVQFLAPVEIGSIIFLESVVSYVSDESLLHVIVHVKNVEPSGRTLMTNILRVNFEHNEPDLCRVYPITLDESWQYIESVRRVKKYLSS